MILKPAIWIINQKQNLVYVKWKLKLKPKVWAVAQIMFYAKVKQKVQKKQQYINNIYKQNLLKKQEQDLINIASWYEIV